MTERFIDHDGIRFHCRLDGREGAPWMVLSNSLVTDLSVWDAQVAAFGDHAFKRFEVGFDGVENPGFEAKIEQRPRISRAYIARSGIVSQVQPPTVLLSRQRRRNVQFRHKGLKALQKSARTRKAGIPPRRKPRA